MADTIDTGTPARWRPGRAGTQERDTQAAECAPNGAARRRQEFVFSLGEALKANGGPVAARTALCSYLDLHHDGQAEALGCSAEEAGALTIACGAFGGSYLSLAAGVPEPVTSRFGPGRMLRLNLDAGTSRPLATYIRLNIGSADGHEVFHETLVVYRGPRSATFDLDGVRLPFDGRLRAWADIIFSRPDSAEITISALSLCIVGKDEL